MDDGKESKEEIDEEIEMLDGQPMGSGAHPPALIKKLSEAILSIKNK